MGSNLWCGFGFDLGIYSAEDGYVIRFRAEDEMEQAVTLLEPWTLFLAVFKLVFDTCIKGTSSPVSNVPEQGLYVFLVHRFPN